MGLADRDYLREPRDGSPGVGRRRPLGAGAGYSGLRALSFNTWLIIVNIAIFLLTTWMATAPSLQRPLFLVQGDVTSEELRTVLKATKKQLQARFDANPPLFWRELAGRSFPISAPDRSGRVVGELRIDMVPLIVYWGHFSTELGFEEYQVWRFVTFQFLHAGTTHLLLNMLGLWFVGGRVEQYLGSKRYAAYYLICGIFGAVSYLILNFLGYYANLRVPGLLFHDPATPLVGASAGIFGVLMAAAFIAPREIVDVFGVIPMKMRTAVYGFTAIAAVSLFMGTVNAGGEAAHLGGAIAGYFFIRRTHLLRDFFDILGRSDSPGGSRRGPPTGPAQVEVDRILAKVATVGMGALTESEKATLRAATAAGQGARAGDSRGL
jgi:membrane associated rhomboid family serine protease